MAAGAEADQLVGVAQVGSALEILAFEPGQINQDPFRGRFAREGGDCHGSLPSIDFLLDVSICQVTVAESVSFVHAIRHGLGISPPPCPCAVAIDLQHRIVLINGIGGFG